MTKAVYPKWGQDGVYRKNVFNPGIDWKHVDVEQLKSKGIVFDSVCVSIVNKYQVTHSSQELAELLQINADRKVWKRVSENKPLPSEQRRAIEILSRSLFRVKRETNKLSPKTKRQFERELCKFYWSDAPKSNTGNGCDEWLDIARWVYALTGAIHRIRKLTQTRKYQNLLELIEKLQHTIELLDHESAGDLVITLSRTQINCPFNEKVGKGPIELKALFYRIDRIREAIEINIEEYKKQERPTDFDLPIIFNRFLAVYQKNSGERITHSSDYGRAPSKGGEPLSKAGRVLKEYFQCIDDWLARYPSTISSLLAEHISNENASPKVLK